MNRRHILFSGIAPLVMTGFALPAQAQAKYPTRPIKLVVPSRPAAWSIRSRASGRSGSSRISARSWWKISAAAAGRSAPARARARTGRLYGGVRVDRHDGAQSGDPAKRAVRSRQGFQAGVHSRHRATASSSIRRSRQNPGGVDRLCQGEPGQDVVRLCGRRYDHRISPASCSSVSFRRRRSSTFPTRVQGRASPTLSAARLRWRQSASMANCWNSIGPEGTHSRGSIQRTA